VRPRPRPRWPWAHIRPCLLRHVTPTSKAGDMVAYHRHCNSSEVSMCLNYQGSMLRSIALHTEQKKTDLPSIRLSLLDYLYLYLNSSLQTLQFKRVLGWNLPKLLHWSSEWNMRSALKVNGPVWFTTSVATLCLTFLSKVSYSIRTTNLRQSGAHLATNQTGPISLCLSHGHTLTHTSTWIALSLCPRLERRGKVGKDIWTNYDLLPYRKLWSCIGCTVTASGVQTHGRPEGCTLR
jgi:hypothetical protein